MADADRVSNGKWSKTLQENDGARDNGYYRGNKRGGGGSGGGNKPDQKIYKPRSGPLRKTGPRGEDECDSSNNNFTENSHSPTTEEGNRSYSGRSGNWRKPSQQLYQPPISSRESTPGPSDIKLVSDKMSQLSTSPSDNHCSDDRKKSKKPEQAIYIPKARAQALASEQSGDSDGASSTQARSSSSRNKFDREDISGREGVRHKTEQSKGSKGNASEPYIKSSKHESLQHTKYDEKRGSGKTDTYGGPSKWDASNRMTKSDTWEQPTKGAKSDVWERGKGTGEFGDWRKPSREVGSSSRGGRSGDSSRSKRFSGSRRNNQVSDEGVRWRPESPSTSGRMYRSESITGLSPSREIRQTSEPRSLPLDPSRHLRDTRSVEPQQHPPLLPALPPKPPSGRRGRDTKQGIKSNLPPRFQKKAEMQAANALDNWDGKSLMFQGHAHTLPHSGSSRGRGRHRHDEMRLDTYSSGSDIRHTRSLTPDQFKRPRTPPSMYQHRAPSPRGRRSSPHHHRTVTPPGYPRRMSSQENVFPHKGGRRSPPAQHRAHSPPHDRNEMRRASSQERRHGGRKSPQHHYRGGGGQHHESGKYRPRSGSNSWDNSDPFYRNRRLSDTTRPPVPSHGHRRPSLGSDDQKPSNTENPQELKVEEEVPLPCLPIPCIKDWSEEVEENDRQMEAMAAAANSSESGPPPGSQRQRTVSESSRRSKSKKNKRRRGGDRGGDDKETPHRSPAREHYTSESHNIVNNRGPHSQQQQSQAQIQQLSGQSSGPHRGGIIILPAAPTESATSPGPTFVSPHMMGHPPPSSHPHQQRVLFDPSNPNKPILVMAGGMRVSHPGHPQFSQFNQPQGDMIHHAPVSFNSQQMPQPFPPGAFIHGYPQKLPIGPELNLPHGADAVMGARPNWYDHFSDSFRACGDPHLLIDMERAEWDLTCILSTVGPLLRWENVNIIRQFLLKSLHTLLMTELKFCQMENIEQYIWKVAFYNVIELLRKGMTEDPNAELKAKYKQTLLTVLEEGATYFEGLLEALQQHFKFSIEHLTGPNAPPFTPHANKQSPYTNLAIISAQKICLYLGDLARYKEQANESSISTYTKARQWYTKAQILNPKNGRPYNQLAILACYARRKLDAVYFYMRSFMASNPFQTARESLLSLFDENRKKFESLEKKRKEERAAEEREKQKEKEALGRGLRREIWIHPDNGQREWRTTSNREKSPDARDEELARMPLQECIARNFHTTLLDSRKYVGRRSAFTFNCNSLCSDFMDIVIKALEMIQDRKINVNKQFVTSYLHVQGKLFTKVGMDTFQEAAVQMLREFRALLQHSPVPVSSTRFLQLLALNMFAIENTQLRDPNIEPGYRSALQECALVMSLQMFNLIIERCSALFPEPSASSPPSPAQPLELSEDLQMLLPAVKVWCDWLLCHKSVWNPPPSCADYSVGPPGNAWSRLAKLVNQLERLDLGAVELAMDQLEGYDLIKLPEDAALAGFTPLMYNIQESLYAKKDVDLEVAQNCLRVKKVQFFGTVFLCGVDPPVLKLQRFDNGRSLYVSVVESTPGTANTSRRQSGDEGSQFESGESERPEGDTSSSSGRPCSPSETPSDIRSLLSRKEELTRTHQSQERHHQQVQAILKQQAAAGGVEMEVRPRLLVPDTNCFIDHLSALQKLTHSYSLMVPLVVLQELEGLARGNKSTTSGLTALSAYSLAASLRHAQHVTESAGTALTYLKSRPTGVRCVTTRGTVLASATFTLEEDSSEENTKNDDRILNTCVSLIRASCRGEDTPVTTSETTPARTGERRHLYRDVVLLTEDRNLRVKALAREVPVRDLPDFLAWAKLSEC